VTGLREHVLERYGCPLHFWEGGREGRPLVVFTHGACVDHHSFDPHLPVIARDYRVLAWDVRGHGRSQPMGRRFTVRLAAEDLLALVGRLGYRNAVFVGHSNGSYIAQEVAFRRPEAVLALVVVDGTCITWRRGPLELFMLRTAAAVLPFVPYTFLKKAGLFLASRRQEVRDYTCRAFSRITRSGFITILQGVLGGLHYEPGYRIASPLLLIHGDDDRMGDIRKIAPLWARREPACRYAVIPGARHFALLDDPDFFNKLLLEFLADWVPRGAELHIPLDIYGQRP